MRLPFDMPGAQMNPQKMALQSALDSPEVPVQQGLDLGPEQMPEAEMPPMPDMMDDGPALDPYAEMNPMEAPGMAMDPAMMGGMMEDQSPYIPNPSGMDAEMQGIPQPGTPEFYDWLMSRG